MNGSLLPRGVLFPPLEPLERGKAGHGCRAGRSFHGRRRAAGPLENAQALTGGSRGGAGRRRRAGGFYGRDLRPPTLVCLRVVLHGRGCLVRIATLFLTNHLTGATEEPAACAVILALCVLVPPLQQGGKAVTWPGVCCLAGFSDRPGGVCGNRRV